jgi:hypothetical protein
MSIQATGLSLTSETQTNYAQITAAFPECRPVGNAAAAAPVETPSDRADKIWDRLAQLKKDLAGQLSGRAVKPMALKGRLRYLETNLEQVTVSAARLDPTQMGTAKHSKTEIDTEIRQRTLELAELKNSGAKFSLAAVQALAMTNSGEATSLENAAKSAELEPDAARKPKARLKVYTDASAVLAIAAREFEDWTAQVAEARAWLGPDAAAFDEPLKQLSGACERLDKVVGRCLPQLTTKIGRKPTNLPDTAADKPIPAHGELKALRECGNSWAAAKQVYGATPVEMKKLADFRKIWVNKWLDSKLGPLQMRNGPGEGWVSLGSDDPTSDYDISINKHGSDNGQIVEDYKIVALFNTEFRKAFGTEPGTLFDTNLYASAPKLVPKLGPEAEQDPEIAEANAEVKASNDVGALMKMRRYMSEGDFEAFRALTLKSCGTDKVQRKALAKQFELADANYRIALQATIDRMEALLAAKRQAIEEKAAARRAAAPGTGSLEVKEEKKEGERDDDMSFEEIEALRAIEKYRAEVKKMDGVALDDAQAALEDLARELEHSKDAMMQTTNEVYVEQIGKLRTAEKNYTAFQSNLPEIEQQLRDAGAVIDVDDAARTARFDKLAETLLKLGAYATVGVAARNADFPKAAAELKRQIAVQLSDIAQQQALAMFFANEAYQSEGPFAHVVTAGQAVETDIKTRLAKEKIGEAQFKALDEQGRNAVMDEVWGQEGSPQRALAKARADDEMAKRRKDLPEDQCLQSFNEQLGDFLKDLDHYAEDEPGVAIIQSSKYLDRLIDAARLMVEKRMFDPKSPVAVQLDAQLKLQQRVRDELIQARKGKLWLVPDTAAGGVEGEQVDQRAQRYALGCAFMKQAFGINSVASLAKQYCALGIDVNAAAREWLARNGSNARGAES